jgi:hypothetical protein
MAMTNVSAEGKPSAGDRLLELTLGWFLPRWVSLPLLLVLALFRALRFERGLGWLRRGGLGLFCLVDTAWLVGTVTLLFMLVFGQRAYGFGIVVGLFLFVLLHSLIVHAAEYFVGYDPAEESMKQGARPEKGGTDGDGSA